MSRAIGATDKARFFRALAHHIHRKQPAEEALAECIEAESRGGRHRQWKPASAALEADGFMAALRATGLLGDEAASILTVVVAQGDHRLLSATLASLAEFAETEE